MKIVGMLPSFNDEDIIQEVIEHLLSQGINLVVLDNGSTDKTYEICKKFVGKGVLQLNQYRSNFYDWSTILRILYDMALRESPDWVLRSDSDEFFESGMKNITLKQAIEKVESERYNLIQFDTFDFFMTDDDNNNAKSVRKRLRYYSCTRDFDYRAWKVVPGIRVEDAGGHYPIFPQEVKYRIYPKKFVERHYSYRTINQANKKLQNRLSRIENTPEFKTGWHFHIEEISKKSHQFIVPHKILTKYNEDNNWNFERKFALYSSETFPNREQIFTNDGVLMKKYKNIPELKLEIQEQYKNYQKLEKEIDERTKWAHELNKSNEERAKTISNLQKEIDEWTKWVHELNKSNDERAKTISNLQKELDKHMQLVLELNKLNNEKETTITSLQKEFQGAIATKDAQIQDLQDKFSRTMFELDSIKNSTSFKTMFKILRTVDKVFPPDTKRGEMLRLSRVSMAIIQNQGFKVFLQAAREKIRIRFNSKKTKSLSSTTPLFALEDLDLIRLESNQKIIQSTKVNVNNQLRKSLKIGSSNIYDLPRIPKISIIISTYNQTAFLKQNIASIEKSTYKNYEIIIVTNNLDENSEMRKFLKTIKHTVLIYDKEYSFTALNNFAAKKSNGEFLLFLNDDVEIVTPTWLESMLKLGLDDKIGAVGPKIIFTDGKLQEAGCIVWKDTSWNYGRNQDPNDFNFNFVRDVDYCSGCCLMVKKNIFEKLNGFDIQYHPAYCEDTDLCLAIRDMGYRVLYQPLATVVHHEGSTQGKDTSIGIKQYQIDNEKKLRKKWESILKNRSNSSPRNVYVERNRKNGANILFIDHYVPEYDKDAGSLMTYYICSILSLEGNNVTFWPDNLNKTEPYVTELQQKGIEVVYGPNDFESFIKERGWAFHVCFMARPHISKKYIDKLRQYAPHCKIVYETHDLHYVRELREAELFGDKKKQEQAMLTREDEFEIIKRSDIVLVVSMHDAKILLNDLPNTNVAIIPPLQIPSDKVPPFKMRRDLLFIGGFQHPPNVDSLNFLISEIMPKINKKLPDVKLVVIGSNAPTAIVEKCKKQNNIEFLGYVENIDPPLNQCRILVAPLRYGAGVKGKITQGLACGIPIVTTSIGAEGMTKDKNILLIADEPDAFVMKVISLYNDEILWNKISINGKKYAEIHYSPEVAQNVLDQILLICLKNFNTNIN